MKVSHVGFLGKFDFSLLLSLGHHVEVLDTHNTTTPCSSELFILIELSSEVLGQSLQVLVVFLLGVGESNTCSGLLVHELSESCLSSDESIGDTLLSAESWEENNHFNGVNIMSNHDELGLALLDELGNVVQTELEDGWLVLLVSLLFSLGSSFGFSLLLESGLLFLFSFWAVLCK